MNIDNLVKTMTLEEKASLCSGHDFWTTESVKRLGIPSLMMCDGPHGLRKQPGEGDHLGIRESIPAPCFPSASALAASFDTELLRHLGETLGNECQSEDVAMLLGPGVNMKRSPLCGRNFEYFSEDPYLAGKLAAAYIQGIQSQGVAACVKHFACNNQETMRMSGSSTVDERTMREIYLPAFEIAVREGGARSVMCAYNKVNGTHASEHRELLTDILREEWAFDGFVVTDWGAVRDRVKGLLAGVDLEMPGGPGSQDEKIVRAVRDGSLDEAVLDQTVRRLLNFVQWKQQTEDRKKVYDITSDQALTTDVEKECAVLLKNEGHVLPLSREAKIAFIGEYAVQPRYQGSGSSRVNAVQVTNALESAAQMEIMDVKYAKGFEPKETKPDTALQEEAVNLARNAQVAVIFAGLPDSFETEGADREHMDLPDNQVHLIRAIASVQPNTVVVLHGGAPVIMPWLDEVKAVLNMYLGGAGVGQATASLLFGEANPSGKLAETWPLRLEDTPVFLNFPGDYGSPEYREGIYIGYRYYDKCKMEVLFPFGYGLSYTTFDYSDLILDRKEMKDSESLSISCTIKNTGHCRGKEIVQLYVNDVESSVGRPVNELKGFIKIELEPGEEKRICFELNYRDFAYYNTRIKAWDVESGAFCIRIGSSSRDIRLEQTVLVHSTRIEQIRYGRSSTLGDLMKSESGRKFMEEKIGRQKKSSQQSETDPLGAGNEKAMEKSTMEIPLAALIPLAGMSEEQLDDLIAMLNKGV